MRTQTKTQTSVDQFSREAIQARIDQENEFDEAIIGAADAKALAKFVRDVKQNPKMLDVELNSLAKQHLADEHGLDLDDLNDDWNDYVTDLRLNANLY